MDVNQQLASVRSDVDKVSKKTIDELNKVAVEGLKTVQSVTAGVEKVQGKVAADAKSALSDAKSAVEKAKADVKQAADKVKQVVEGRVVEVRVGRVVGGHRIAVALGERPIEVGDGLAVLLGGRHGADPTRPAPPAWRVALVY